MVPWRSIKRLCTGMCFARICTSASASTPESTPWASGVDIGQPLVGHETAGACACGGGGASATTGVLWAQSKSVKQERMAIRLAPARVNFALRELPRRIVSLRFRPWAAPSLQRVYIAVARPCALTREPLGPRAFPLYEEIPSKPLQRALPVARCRIKVYGRLRVASN